MYIASNNETAEQVFSDPGAPWLDSCVRLMTTKYNNWVGPCNLGQQSDSPPNTFDRQHNEPAARQQRAAAAAAPAPLRQHDCALIAQPQFLFQLLQLAASLQIRPHVSRSSCPTTTTEAYSPPATFPHNAVLAPPKHSVAHNITLIRPSTILYTPLYG